MTANPSVFSHSTVPRLIQPGPGLSDAMLSALLEHGDSFHPVQHLCKSHHWQNTTGRPPSTRLFLRCTLTLATASQIAASFLPTSSTCSKMSNSAIATV